MPGVVVSKSERPVRDRQHPGRQRHRVLEGKDQERSEPHFYYSSFAWIEFHICFIRLLICLQPSFSVKFVSRSGALRWFWIEVCIEKLSVAVVLD